MLLVDAETARLKRAKPNSKNDIHRQRRSSLRFGDGDKALHIVLQHKSKFLLEKIIGIDLVYVLLASSAVTLLVNTLEHESHWVSSLTNSKAAVGTLGAFYSFALVFRTNICYARWWEGRTLWGTMIVNCICIAQQGRLWIEDKALAHRLGYLAIAYAYACKAQLRGNMIEDDGEGGAELVQKGIISTEELSMMASQNAWQPYYCIDAMREAIDEGLKSQALRGNYPDWKMNAIQQAMEDTIRILSKCVGGCIRVQSTGLPVAYDVILNSIGGIFFATACVAWAPGVGFYNPILVLIVYVASKMLVGVGNDLEDPFSHHPSCLPLGKFCATIVRQIEAINARSQMNQKFLKDYSTFASRTTRIGFPSEIELSMSSSMDDDEEEVKGQEKLNGEGEIKTDEFWQSKSFHY